MANKRAKQRKPKQPNSSKGGQKGGTVSQEISSPRPVKKKK